MKDRTNAEWLADLRSPDAAEALTDLRTILLRGLRAALYGRIRNNLESITEDFAQDALIRILDKMHTFRGESRFTTWAQKIAINVAYTELRRRRWKDISLQEMVENQDGNDFTPAILTDPSAAPEKEATQRAMLAFVHEMIEEELTERQRVALKAVMLKGVPLEEVARRMGTNRNALYKLLHDARRRLQRGMQARGLPPREVLAVFE